MVILNTALISDSLIIDLMSISEFITMDTLIGKYIIIYIFFLYSIKNLDRTMTKKNRWNVSNISANLQM